MQDTMYTRLTALGIILLVISVVVVGCKNDEDDGGGGNGGGGGTTQIDRMAVPGVNTALISTANKNAFNQGDPSTDVANYQTEITTNITNLRAAVSGVLGAEDSPGFTPAQVTAIVCPDVVSINFASAVQFPNGRQLQDDVMDPVLGLVLNRGDPLGSGPGVSDAISNDSTFLGTFPYLAAANP